MAETKEITWKKAQKKGKKKKRKKEGIDHKGLISPS
jgi:hypothetical protein